MNKGEELNFHSWLDIFDKTFLFKHGKDFLKCQRNYFVTCAVSW